MMTTTNTEPACRLLMVCNPDGSDRLVAAELEAYEPAGIHLVIAAAARFWCEGDTVVWFIADDSGHSCELPATAMTYVVGA
jgi:hypothetical protein